MPFCPNPECPHRQKTGKSPEFREGITHCSDCGSHLTEKITETGTTGTAEKGIFSLTLPNDLKKRVLLTIGLIILWRIIVLIPVPGLDSIELERFIMERSGALTGFFGMFSSGALFRVSVFALGIMPYISAYVLVEILSLFIPPLKSWRQQGYAGRGKLLRTALWATLALALLQGYGIARGIEGMAGGAFVINHGMGFRLLTTITLATGTFITLLIANLITRKGIGHGISILLIVGYTMHGLWDILQFSGTLSRISEGFHTGSHPAYLMISIIGTALLVILIVFIEKSHRRIQVRYDDNTEAYIPLKLTTAGIEPVGWASGILMLPITLAAFSSNLTLQKMANSLAPGGIIYFILLFATIIFLYYLFTSFFYNPGKIRSFLKERNASIIVPPGEDEERYIDRSLEALALVGSLYLCFIYFIPEIPLWFSDSQVGVMTISISALGSVPLIVIVAIALDLIGETRIRKTHNLIKVAELHDVAKAGLLKSLLEGKGIPCHLGGYYHRALLYFFGPFIEISALVPKDKTDEANDVIKRYFIV
jgi:preprotein translocase subunit SecY